MGFRWLLGVAPFAFKGALWDHSCPAGLIGEFAPRPASRQMLLLGMESSQPRARNTIAEAVLGRDAREMKPRRPSRRCAGDSGRVAGYKSATLQLSRQMDAVLDFGRLLESVVHSP